MVRNYHKEGGCGIHTVVASHYRRGAAAALSTSRAPLTAQQLATDIIDIICDGSP